MQDKGLMYLHGKMMIEHVIEQVSEITGSIMIITKNPAYRKLGYPCYTDVFTDRGPLGGIYTGLINSSTKKNLVVGCDTPFLSENILSALINKSKDEDVLITQHKGKSEPLCAIYDINCISHFDTLLQQEKLKITDALQNLNTVVINFDNEDWFKENVFANINTPEELKKFDNTKK